MAQTGAGSEEEAEELDRSTPAFRNPIINEFLTAEYRLSKMMSEIQSCGKAVGAWIQMKSGTGT